jgi:hypothetical protein
LGWRSAQARGPGAPGSVEPTSARSALPDQRSDAEPPGLPCFRTWRGVYLFVLGWFVLTVVLLAVFARIFS